ncbi:MAG: WD40 repeat domain-containing protein [Planctomycetales bacterium]|nr:WD40 repeat domain-containing protein [Planctomycetales bacterium]
MRHTLTSMLVVYVCSFCAAQSTQPELRAVAKITPFVNSAFALAVDPARSRIAIAGRRGEITVYDSQSFGQVGRIDAVGGMVLAMSFDPDGTHLFASGDPKRVSVYRSSDLTLQQTIELPFRCGFIGCHPRLPIVVLGGAGDAILFFNYETGKMIGKMDRKIDRAFDVQFTSDGSNVLAIAKTIGASISPHNLIAVDTSSINETDFAVGSPPYRVIGNSNVGFHSLTLADDGQRFAVADSGGRIVVYDVRGLRPTRTFTTTFGQGRGMAFVDDDSLVSVTESGVQFFGPSQEDQTFASISEETPSANHLMYDARQRQLVMSHARAANQLTAWRIDQGNDMDRSAAAPEIAALNDSPSKTAPAMGFAGPIGPTDSSKRDAETPSQKITTTDLTATGDEPADVSIYSRLFVPSEHPARTWTAVDGKRQLTSQLIGVDGDDVLLWLDSGREAMLKRSSLSREDGDFVRQFEQQYPSKTDWPKLSDDLIAVGLCPFNPITFDPIKRDDVNVANDNGALTAKKCTVLGSVPDRRGGFYLMTNIGLAKYHPQDGDVVLITGPPTSGLGMLSTPMSRIDELVVDKFGRAIVRFTDSRNSYRWNGFDWVNLWCELEGGIHSLVTLGDDVYAILNGQHSSFNKLASPKRLLLRLVDDQWKPVPLALDNSPLEDLERLHLFGSKKLLCIRQDSPPVIFDGGRLSVLDAPEATASRFEQLAWTTHKFVATPSEQLVYLRQPPVVKGYGRAEMVMAGFDGAKVWNNEVDFIDQHQPRSLWCDHLGRVWVRFRDNSLFTVTPQTELQPITLPVAKDYSLVVDAFQNSGLRDRGLATRSLYPFSQERTWQAASGSSIQAACVTLNDEFVRLRTADGRLLTVNRNLLSENDGRFLENLDWHRRHREVNTTELQIVSRQRTRRGTFVNWDKMPDDEKAKILPRINDVSVAQAGSDHPNVFFATERGLERWDGGKLTLLAAAPDDLKRMSAGEPSPLDQVCALPDGTVLGIFATDKRVFRWAGDGWHATGGSESLEISKLTLIGDDVFAIAKSLLGDKPRRSGVVKLSTGQRWQMVLEHQNTDDQSVFTAAQITAFGKEQYMVTWDEYKPQSRDFDDPGSTYFTFHTKDETRILSQRDLQTAQRHDGQYIHQVTAEIHGVITARSAKPPARLLRWCTGEPVATAVVETVDSNRIWGNALSVKVASDGAVWSLSPSTVYRVDDHSIASIEIDDKTATTIDITSDDRVLVQGEFLTVVKFTNSSQNTR